MKESKLVEIKNKVETTGRVLNQIIGEIKMLDDRLSGLYAFVQSLPDYEKTLEELKRKQDEINKDASTDTDNEQPT